MEREHHLAYQAFLFYRDMGPSRNVKEAFRQSSGNPDAKQANGSYNRWCKDFRWYERAVAFDAYQFDLKKAAEARAMIAAGFDLSKERHKAVRAALEYGDLLMQRGKIILGWPLADKIVKKKITARSGETIETETHYEAVDARNVAASARIGQIGMEMIRDAIDLASAIDAGPGVQGALDAAQTQGAIEEAERLWEVWEAEHRVKREAYQQRQLPSPASGTAGGEP